jgi:hypothetical protein
LNGRKILDPWHAQQIPLRLSLFSSKKLGFHYQKARNKHFSKLEERISSLQELDLFWFEAEELKADLSGEHQEF